ncbi:MAG: efflux RND transporter permease subunit [Terrimicrobiaceae bacterium]|nr:efflux RND transporter permease subunit [Terrimicrobiaceae bacterium]
MNLSAPFIRRPVMTTLAALSALAFGITAFLTLPNSDLPNAAYPVITVTTNYPGASPQIMANNVSTPLELQMMQIQGLSLVTSQNMTGSSTIVLQFALSKPMESAATDVQAAIQRAMGNLPADLPAPPSFQLTNPNDKPISYIGVSSDTLPLGDLYDYANNLIAQRMSMITGVSQAMVYGSPRAVRIKADPNALASRNVTLGDLSTAVQNATVFQPAGSLNGPRQSYTVNPNGQLLHADDYKDVIIRYEHGAPVRIRDVAVSEEGQDSEYERLRMWIAGQPERPSTNVVAITAGPGSNAVQVAESVRKTLKEIRATLPRSIQTKIIYERSTQILDSIADVKFTILLAFALVVLVIFLFLGRLNETIIPSFALPMALFLTFALMSVCGFGLDNLSLMALTLAVGFLVDDAIVVLENTVRHLEMGETPVQAALNGAKEISFTVLSMTLSLSAVFIPLVFMPGLLGRMFHEFALTIVFAILMSGLVAITLSPMMCARLLKKRDPSDRSFVERKVNAIFASLHRGYGRSLRWMLRHKWMALVVWVATLAGSILLYQAVPKTFLPVGDSGTMLGPFIAREGTSPAQMQAYQARIMRILEASPYLQKCVSVTSFGGLPGSMGLAWCELKPEGLRPPIDEVYAKISGQIYEQVPGVLPLIRPVPTLQISAGATSNQQGEFAYTLTSADPETLYAAAANLLAKLQTEPGFLQVSSDMRHQAPFLDVNILRDQAYTYGVPAQSVEQALQLGYSGGRVAQIMTPLNQYDVIVELQNDMRRFPKGLERLRVRGDSGLVPLRSVASWKTGVGPETINHINQITSVTIFFNLQPGFPVGTATARLDALAAETLPPGIRGSLAGEAQQFQQTISGMVVFLFIAIFAMYVILGILYESYIHPITVLSSLPTAGVGGLLMLWLFGMSLSLYGFIGLFLLIGIVKKNGIMVVDFAIQRLREGRELDDAIVEACEERLRPILMTTFAAVFGAIPIALGIGSDGASRQPLGICIVGGLLISQVLTLYVTPVFYYYMERFQTRVLDRIAFFQRGDAVAET